MIERPYPSEANCYHQKNRPLGPSVTQKRQAWGGLSHCLKEPKKTAQTNNKSAFRSVAVGMLAWDDGNDHMPAATQHTQLSRAVTIVRNQLVIEKLKDNPRYSSFEPPEMRTTRTRKASTKNRRGKAGMFHPLRLSQRKEDSYGGETL